MTGAYPKTHVFPAKVREQTFSTEDLWRSAKERQAWAAMRSKGSGDDELDREVMDGTWDEVSRGWLLGPFEPAPAS